MDTYDVDIQRIGISAWQGTFASIIRHAIDDVTYDGSYGPMEVTLCDGRTLTGKISPMGEYDRYVLDDDIGTSVVELDDIDRLRF